MPLRQSSINNKNKNTSTANSWLLLYFLLLSGVAWFAKQSGTDRHSNVVGILRTPLLRKPENVYMYALLMYALLMYALLMYVRRNRTRSLDSNGWTVVDSTRYINDQYISLY
ncbi:hypothetical protein K440DRAFT_397535 [Wilcoxina mikolae CBS 423.85]|nr:hypothetical protein K440DRAFT_397535 [Wilcoxina mikolae CBS 423.85]